MAEAKQESINQLKNAAAKKSDESEAPKLEQSIDQTNVKPIMLDDKPPQENMVKVKFNRCWGSGKYYEADGKEISFKDALAKYGNSAINLHKIYKEGEVAWLPENIAAHLMNDHVETYNPTPGVLNKSQVAAGVAELPKVSTAQRVKSKE